MIRIELPPRPVFRGEPLKGSVHITSESTYTAKEVLVRVLRKETFLSFSGISPHFVTKSVKNVVFSAKDVYIAPPERKITFEVPIPEGAPFTFEGKVAKTEWYIQVSVKAGIMPKKVSQEFVVLPHVLKSGHPVDEVPLPHQEYSDVLWDYRPFHMWQLSLFRKSTHIKMIADRDCCSPGDTVSGGIYFSRDFVNADINIYWVFVNKSKHIQYPALTWHRDTYTGEEEQLVAHAHDTFHNGMSFRFSFPIPDTTYPTFETKHIKAWWIVRAVVSCPLRFTKVSEKEIVIAPLVF